MKVAIVKYSAGNTRSVICALQRLGVDPMVTDDPKELQAADKVVFPGEGEARTAMTDLREKGLVEVIRNLKKPFLGICLGEQLLCTHSEEHNTDCLGIIDVPVVRFPEQNGVKIPHMGWNTVSFRRGEKLFEGLGDQAWCYFVHSYYVPVCPFSIGLTQYDGITFTSVLRKDNFYASQFHMEKSGNLGELMLKNFLELV